MDNLSHLSNDRRFFAFPLALPFLTRKQREELQSLCRVMSGFTDEFYRQTTAFYQDGRILDGPKPYYRTGMLHVDYMCDCVCDRVGTVLLCLYTDTRRRPVDNPFNQ